MRAFENKGALLAIGAAAFVAACGGVSGSSPDPMTTTVITHAASAQVVQAPSWKSVKWGGGGYVSGLIYHPTSPNLLYARTDIGGAYRWDQAGAQWVPITDGLGFSDAEAGFHYVESIGLDPTNDQLVYLVAGNGGNGRLYTSTNRGTSWTWITLPFVVHGNHNGRAVGERLRLDPTNPSTMFYGSRMAGLWKSSDSGHTWAQVTGLSSYTTTTMSIGVEQIIFDNANVGGGQTTWNMWAAIAPDYASAAGLTSIFYRSSNGGFSWTPVAVPAAVTGYYIPHYARAADGMYYVVFNKNAGPGGDGPGYLYRYSGVNGGTWTLLSSSTTGGYGGVSAYGSGATTRLALAVTNTWGDYVGQKITQLSDNAGSTWREIESQMPHAQNAGYWGWNDDIEIDPNNRDHILHLDGPGIWETTNASSATPNWTVKVNNIEETATLSVTTPPANATYKLINSAGDIGTWVQTDLAATPTRGPTPDWVNGNSADMSWADPQYIAAVGAKNGAGGAGYGYWSGDGGVTWANFASLPAGAAADGREASNIAVTARNKAIWAPSNAVPSYTTDNGASWTATNLPALTEIGGWSRAYRLAADRKNPNKVYAYDSGGAWWGTPGKVYVSTDGGHTFALSQGSVSANLRANPWSVTSMAVNPNVEGDIWLADGNTVYHSMNSGATWTKLPNFASNWGGRPDTQWPDAQGASFVALGKAATGAPYSATIYVVGVVNGQWGVWASDNSGSSWTRFNDDAHQFGGIRAMAADWNTYGRIYVNGTGRGLLYSN